MKLKIDTPSYIYAHARTKEDSILKYQYGGPSPFLTSLKQMEEGSKAFARFILKGLNKVGEVFNTVVTAGGVTDFGQTSPFVQMDRQRVHQARVQTVNKAKETVTKAMPAVSPSSWAVGLANGGGPWRGAEIIGRADPRLQVLAAGVDLATFAKGPKAAKQIPKTVKRTINTVLDYRTFGQSPKKVQQAAAEVSTSPTPKVILHTPTPELSGAMLLYQRPQKISFAEQLGLPKSVRNNLNIDLQQALSDAQQFYQSGQYQDKFLYRDGRYIWDSHAKPSDTPGVTQMVLSGGNAHSSVVRTQLPDGTLSYYPTIGTTGYSARFPKPDALTYSVGEATVRGDRNYANMILTSPRTDLLSEAPALSGIAETLPNRISGDIMKNFWIRTGETTKPGTYISGDAGRLPIGATLISDIRNHKLGLVAADLTGKYDTTGGLARSRTGLSVDSYMSILKQGQRPGYELRWGQGFGKFNSSGVDNKPIYDAWKLATDPKFGLTKAAQDVFVLKFNDWVAPFGGRPALVVDGRIIIPHPYLYKTGKIPTTYNFNIEPIKTTPTRTAPATDPLEVRQQRILNKKDAGIVPETLQTTIINSGEPTAQIEQELTNAYKKLGIEEALHNTAIRHWLPNYGYKRDLNTPSTLSWGKALTIAHDNYTGSPYLRILGIGDGFTWQNWNHLIGSLRGKRFGEFKGAGAEQIVYSDLSNPNQVLKVLSDMGFAKPELARFSSLMNHRFSDRNKVPFLQHQKLEGFVKVGEKYYPVTKQKLLTPLSDMTDLMFTLSIKPIIHKSLTKEGFVLDSNNRYSNGNITLEDLKPSNMGFDENGNLRFFDVLAFKD